jgi:hypothetical protein
MLMELKELMGLIEMERELIELIELMGAKPMQKGGGNKCCNQSIQW